jgi:hypothetical protein
MIEALNNVFLDDKPMKIQTDSGKEFESPAMQRFFAENNVEQFSVKSQFKAAMVERFNRTLKSKMWKYFTHNNTHRWLEILPQLIAGYNKAFNRSIGTAPEGVNEETEMEMWMMNEPGEVHSTPTGVEVGDTVRISKSKHVFEKGYLPNWSTEVFEVTRILNTKPAQVKIKDLLGEEIGGSFYMDEVQKVDKPEEYQIEKVLRTRKVGNKKEYFVKWIGYPEKFNEWVGEDQVRRL